LYLSVLLLTHSAALRYLVVRVFNQNWAYLLDGGVAGQRLLGSVLQPSAFGVLLVLSVYLFLSRKNFGAVICLVLASTFHPTYLPSAAMLTLVYMGLLFQEKRNLRASLVLGTSTLLGVMPVLYHAFQTFWGTEPKLSARAQELLVNFRIPHHAIPAEWIDGSTGIKIILILLALYLTRKTQLFHILFWPFAAATIGTLLQIFRPSDVLALLFPWRMSTWLVPLSAGVVIFWCMEHLVPWLDQRVSGKTLVITSTVLAICLAGTGLAKSIGEAREKMNGNDRPMMAFIHENKSPVDVYLIPLDMQDFRLETGAPAFAEWESLSRPQQANRL